MWLLVLILSIKLQMPTWYWIIFTIITILRPLFIEPIKFEFYQGIIAKRINKLLTFYNYKFLDVDVRLFFMPFY